jgi:DNA-binding Lrp family transcriptional regulator
MNRLILDKTDLNILTVLAKDSRTSYRSAGSMVGLTSKSVKSRVKSMAHNGIIEKFIVRVNPAGFGYRTVHVVVKTNNAITKDEVIERITQFGDIAYYVYHMGRTLMAALIIKESLYNNNIINSLNNFLAPAVVHRTLISELPASVNVSETDLGIMKCLLLSGARMEISDIAKKLGVSEKTITRRLDRMKEGHLLEFSVQCDAASIVGYIQFAILISVEKSYYHYISERMYLEFKEKILYRHSIIDPGDFLTFILFGENVFMIDLVLAKVDSFKGVKNADVYIVTKLQYHNDWIIREIDERLSLSSSSSSSRLVADKSMGIASSF